MLDPETTRQADLREGRGPWRDNRIDLPWQPNTDERCDILVVGAGITGALVAHHLTELGHQVLIIDRESPGEGSTAASTALLQWEIDTPLGKLCDLYGFERASRTYHRSFQAVRGLSALAAALPGPHGLIRRPTLYLAPQASGAELLEREHAMRRRAELPGGLLTRADLLAQFRIDREGAILSPGSAEADPLALAHALLRQAATNGARLRHGEACAYEPRIGGTVVTLADGSIIEASRVVLATGYVMPDFARSPLHSTASSFVIATAPQSKENLWRDGALIWEASDDYMYARTTTDSRIILGGGDEDCEDAEARERLGPAKTASLQRNLAELWPHADCEADRAWSGAFGKTSDGLPLIGPIAGYPGVFAAYGYGGNGITFSYMASRMIGAMIAGETRPWFADFSIDRPDPGG
ncbi:FAD-binding oxidoreductase [Phreatobacter aquaticus]|uniref:FAD-binding oxidoreductase n=1 Tax=Phreatobacter aquaticus TaxID=2570229 RepID=A0A4D7QD07_9HYPH|nr:FAD-binding oxidoreductase [Phreatobacter aquaticus]QCK85088.1 FAD-binding oxidoreductase [Phreatobacter aquaticus]